MNFHELIDRNGKDHPLGSVRPLALAYLGDTIFDLYIRCVLVSSTSMDTHRMHETASSFANAKSQAALLHKILPDLTEEEEAVFKHGRNQKPLTLPKNQSPVDYKVATGLEALLGYLYLNGREDRILELLTLGQKRLEEENDHE